ncbi:MAG: amino acid ABC transporter permease [Bradyrhizobiaceae bacterium]|nr:amino acid ABC transporter permease [Bradyrhizobiaceae bacterium]
MRGAGTTVAVCSIAIAAGIPLGLAIAAARTGRNGVLRLACALYSSFVRATPLVTFVMLIYFGLPALGVEFDPLPAAVIALALNTAAFNSEIWRAAIADFPRGQLDAARSFGMTRRTAFWRIVFPQIWRRSVAPIVNEMTLLIKASPAIAVIGVVDLTRKARQIAESTYEPLPAFTSAVIVYGIVLIVLVIGGRLLEQRISGRGA